MKMDANDVGRVPVFKIIIFFRIEVLLDRSVHPLKGDGIDGLRILIEPSQITPPQDCGSARGEE